MLNILNIIFGFQNKVFLVAVIFVSLFIHVSCTCTCTLANWESWGSCSKSCGLGGTQRRGLRVWTDNRYCNRNAPASNYCTVCQNGNSYVIMGVCINMFGMIVNDRLFTQRTQQQGCNMFCYNSGRIVLTSYYPTTGFCRCRVGNRGDCCEEQISCGRPSTISNGSFIGSVYTYGNQVQYKCDRQFRMTDTSLENRTCTEQGYWTGKAPQCIYAAYCKSSPCQNNSTCVDLPGKYVCQCKQGWTGQHCEMDNQAPIVHGCPENRTILTANMKSFQTWEVPNITDPHQEQLEITTNYRNNSYEFPWGNFIVQYHAVKPSNGLTAECTFAISVKPHPCEKLKAPKHGILACNKWKSDHVNVCMFVCLKNYTLPIRFNTDDLYVCGASGSWLPQSSVTECEIDEFSPWKNADRNGITFESCSTVEDKRKIGEHYINILNKSPFNSLCVNSQRECKPGNVLIEC